MQDKEIVLITGVSSGIGYQTAELLAEQGYRVYGAARHIEKMSALTSIGVIPIQLDLTQEASIRSAMSQINQLEGGIDILINNAGYGSYGAVENVSIEEAKQQLEVNLFGSVRLIQLVLPSMRLKKHGRIINVSSIAGRIPTFMGAWYHASKYALEGLSDSLRMETKSFGIQVVLIEPGGIKTNWGFIAADHLSQSSKATAYEAVANQAADKMRQLYSSKHLSKATLVSQTILKAASSTHPRPRYLVGTGAKSLVLLHTILPSQIFDALIKKVF